MKDCNKFFSSPKVLVDIQHLAHLFTAGQMSIVEIRNQNKLSKYKKKHMNENQH